MGSKIRSVLSSIRINRAKLENISFKLSLFRRNVRIRNIVFKVYAWHPKPWSMKNSPPISWILDNVKPKDVIYDIGANRGYITLATLSHIPNVNIIAFEPNPETVTKLKANLDLNNVGDKVKVMDYALGSEKRISQFNIAFSDSASSINLSHARNRGKGIKAVLKLQVESIDNLVFRNFIPSPNHIKIDTEGSEADILRGARKTIQKYHPVIYSEIHIEKNNKTNENIIRSILMPYNYSIIKAGMQLLCIPKN